MEDSVAAKSKLPTKMFFISSSVFQSCALELGRFGPRPGCCRTLKRLFKYSRTLPTDRRALCAGRTAPSGLLSSSLRQSVRRIFRDSDSGPAGLLPPARRPSARAIPLSSLFYRSLPNLLATRLALETFHFPRRLTRRLIANTSVPTRYLFPPRISARAPLPAAAAASIAFWIAAPSRVLPSPTAPQSRASKVFRVCAA